MMRLKPVRTHSCDDRTDILPELWQIKTTKCHLCVAICILDINVSVPHWLEKQWQNAMTFWRTSSGPLRQLHVAAIFSFFAFCPSPSIKTHAQENKAEQALPFNGAQMGTRGTNKHTCTQDPSQKLSHVIFAGLYFTLCGYSDRLNRKIILIKR